MPGIAGIFTTHVTQDSVETVASMLACTRHEPFYVSGPGLRNDSIGVIAGWTSHLGDTRWGERGDVSVVLSGEEFSSDDADLDYVIRLYEKHGVGCLERLNGSFSGLLLDRRERQAILFNDRFGTRRVHVHEDRQGVFFAAEAKSLLRVLPELRELDPRGIGEFLACDCVMQNRTIFSGISLLPPGSAWVWSRHRGVRKEVYFRGEVWEGQPELSPAAYFDQFAATWKRVLPRYVRRDAPIALSLTGGVDSRLILASASSPPETLPCYTFGGELRDSADVTIARRLAAASGQPHHTIRVDARFFSEFPGLAARSVYLSDGGMDVTGAVDLYLQKQARSIAPIRLTGVYGGEILRRMVVVQPRTVHPDLLRRDARSFLHAAAATYAEETKGHPLSFVAFKQASWYMTPKFAVERSQVRLRTPYFDNELVALAYRSPESESATNASSRRLIAVTNPRLEKIGTDRGLTLESAWGLRALRHAYHQFTFKAEYAFDYGMPQWLARVNRIAGPVGIEQMVLGRHKLHHFRMWYRDRLAPYVRDVLLDDRALGRWYVNRRMVDRMIRCHTEGRGNFTVEIHKMLTLELLQQQLVDVASGPPVQPPVLQSS
jgi:asparagine synthase (glutamine-hydrolysing)